MFRQIRTIAFYTLLEALRNRLVWIFAAVAVAGIGVSGYLNALALTESRQLQAGVMAALLHFSAVFVLAIFVVTSSVREWNDKVLELLLGLPLPRSGYLFGKLLGYAALAVVPAALYGLLACAFATPGQAALWGVSLLCELWIVVAFSMLCVLTFSQTMTAVSAVGAFYLLARSMNALQLISSAQSDEALSQRVMGFVIDAIAYLLPKLDVFARTEWLVYGTGSWPEMWSVLGQTSIYLTLLTGAALFDLHRKNI